MAWEGSIAPHWLQIDAEHDQAQNHLLEMDAKKAAAPTWETVRIICLLQLWRCQHGKARAPLSCLQRHADVEDSLLMH